MLFSASICARRTPKCRLHLAWEGKCSDWDDVGGFDDACIAISVAAEDGGRLLMAVKVVPLQIVGIHEGYMALSLKL